MSFIPYDQLNYGSTEMDHQAMYDEGDRYFGHQQTDITKQFETPIPSHSYNPKILNAPDPYHVIPYHDLSDKFRMVIRGPRQTQKEDCYYGRTITEISSPIRFPELATDVPLLPWPETSKEVGDLRFTRFEYLHPLGKAKPGPMDDFILIKRDKSGRVRGTPSPPPCRKAARRRMLGLPVDGCHRPGSPCRSRSPSPPRDYDDEAMDDDLGSHHNHRKPRPHGHDNNNKDDDDDVASSQRFRSDSGPPQHPPTTACCGPSGRSQGSSGFEQRPLTTPTPRRSSQIFATYEEPPPRPRERKKSYQVGYGSKTLHVQPVGGRPQRTHADEMELRGQEPPQSPTSYQTREPEGPRPMRYSLGSNSHDAQPVGGRPSRINLEVLERARQTSPLSDYNDNASSYQSRSRGKEYMHHHPSFMQSPSPRDAEDEAFNRHKFKTLQDGDRSSASSRSRKLSTPPRHDPNLPPESQRGRSHRKSSNASGGESGRRGHCGFHGTSPCPAQAGASCRTGKGPRS